MTQAVLGTWSGQAQRGDTNFALAKKLLQMRNVNESPKYADHI